METNNENQRKMIEKKTTEEICPLYRKSDKGKVWISEDSLKENLFDMYRLMCNKYGKANIWNMNADELLENVDLLINEILESAKEND